MSCGNNFGYNERRRNGGEFFGELANYNRGSGLRNNSYFNNNVDFWRGNICYDVEMAFTGPYFYPNYYGDEGARAYEEGIYNNNFRRNIREEVREERRDFGCGCECDCGWDF